MLLELVVGDLVDPGAQRLAEELAVSATMRIASWGSMKQRAMPGTLGAPPDGTAAYAPVTRVISHLRPSFLSAMRTPPANETLAPRPLTRTRSNDTSFEVGRVPGA